MDEGEVQSNCDDLLDRFMAALNAHDSAAMDACMIGIYDSLYVATCRDGRWGIQARSSFGP